MKSQSTNPLHLWPTISVTATCCKASLRAALATNPTRWAAARSDSAAGRRVAVLVSDGVEGASIDVMRKALLASGATLKIIAPRLGEIASLDGLVLKVDHSLLTVSSVLFDAVLIPGGAASASALCADPNAVLFVKEVYKYGKSIAAMGDGASLVASAARSAGCVDSQFVGQGVAIAAGKTANAAVAAAFAKRLVQSVAQHRFPERKDLATIIA